MESSCCLVRKERLELSQVTLLEPKSSASTNSATFAYKGRDESRPYRYNISPAFYPMFWGISKERYSTYYIGLKDIHWNDVIEEAFRHYCRISRGQEIFHPALGRAIHHLLIFFSTFLFALLLSLNQSGLERSTLQETRAKHSCVDFLDLQSEGYCSADRERSLLNVALYLLTYLPPHSEMPPPGITLLIIVFLHL